MSVKNLHLTGGEPLLRGDVFEILAAAKNGASVSLFSNLSAINRDKARRLSSLGIHLFTSIDGANKNTHEAMRGPGAWVVLMRSIRVLREIMESNSCPDCALSEKCRGGCYARSNRRYGVFNNRPLMP